MVFTAYDRSLLTRTLGLVATLLGAAFVVVLATDEVGSQLGARVARLAAFTPALAMAACLIVSKQAELRGELATLAAIGVTQARSLRGARWAAWCAVAVALAFVASPLADPGALFPAVAGGAEWSLVGGRLVDAASGVSVGPAGDVSFGAAQNSSVVAPSARLGAALTVAALGAAGPWWVTRATGRMRVVAVGCTLLLTIGMLHAVAAGRVGVWWLPLCALPLVLDGLRFGGR